AAEAIDAGARRDEVLLRIARCFHELGRDGESIAAVLRHRRECPASPRLAEGLFLEGTGLLRTGRMDEAQAVLRALEREHPGSEFAPLALRAAAQGHARQGTP